MYSKGVSTWKMAAILEELFHNRYSTSTVSRITDITVPEISKWTSRPLKKSYIAIFMDAMFFSLRRETLQKGYVIFAMIKKEPGNCEILGFYMNPLENHVAYENVLIDLNERDLEKDLFFIADGLPGNSGGQTIISQSRFQVVYITCIKGFLNPIRGFRSGMRSIHT